MDRMNVTTAEVQSDSQDFARQSIWTRVLLWIKDFDEALQTTYDDLQDRRILALEREVSTLKTQVRLHGHD